MENNLELIESGKKISLKCEHCNGTLIAENNKAILACPYCGNQALVPVNTGEIQEKQDVQIQVANFKKAKISKLLILAFLICGVLTYSSFSNGRTIAGILSAVQMFFFGSSWFIGMRFLKVKNRYIYVLLAIIGMLLFAPIAVLGIADRYTHSVNWEIIFMGDEIPKPKFKQIEIDENTDTALRVEAEKVSDEEYYKYVSECKKMGYTVELNESSSSYSAYNEAGYYLDIFHYGTNQEVMLRLTAPTPAAELDWENHSIGSVLPAPRSAVGAYEYEWDKEVRVIVSDTTKGDYFAYMNECIAKGFDIDSKKEDISYDAYDGSGNKLHMSYESGNREMSITLDFPMRFRTITWPVSGIGTLAPIPESLSGNVDSDYDWIYSVYVENTTREEYEAYVQQCIDAGFNKDVREYGDSVRADYSDDISIQIEYKGFNIMYVSVSGSSSESYESYTR